MLAVLGGHANIVRALIHANADVNARNTRVQTSLMLAVMDQNLPMVELLLTAPGIDVNIPDESGWTPVIQAIEDNSPTIVRALVNAGADVHIPRNQPNLTAFQRSIWKYYQHPDIVIAMLPHLNWVRAYDETISLLNSIYKKEEEVSYLVPLDIIMRDLMKHLTPIQLVRALRQLPPTHVLTPQFEARFMHLIPQMSNIELNNALQELPTDNTFRRRMQVHLDRQQAIGSSFESRLFKSPDMNKNYPGGSSKSTRHLFGYLNGVDVARIAQSDKTTYQWSQNRKRKRDAGDGSGASGRPYQNECSICGVEYNRFDETTRLNCNHVFHTDCIQKWRQTMRIKVLPETCPICRSQLVDGR